MGERELTAEAQADRDNFEAEFGSGNCSCHISPPCGSCTHPGNPSNQDEDDACWQDSPPIIMAGHARTERQIEADARKWLPPEPPRTSVMQPRHIDFLG